MNLYRNIKLLRGFKMKYNNNNNIYKRVQRRNVRVGNHKCLFLDVKKKKK